MVREVADGGAARSDTDDVSFLPNLGNVSAYGNWLFGRRVRKPLLNRFHTMPYGDRTRHARVDGIQ